MHISERIKERVLEYEESVEKDASLADLFGDSTGVTFGSGVEPPRKTKKFLASATSWVYGCTRAIAEDVSAIDLKLLKVNGKNGKEVESHDALDVLNRAKNITTRFDLFYSIQNYIDLAGEAPLFVNFQNGKPSDLLLIRPERLKLKPGKDGELIGGYTYQVNTKSGVEELQLEPFEVVFLKTPDPNNPFRGKGVLSAMINTFDIDDFSERYNRKFFFNSATPSAVLETDKKIADEVKRKLERKLKESHGTYVNAHKFMILEKGLKWKPMQLNAKEMDFINTMKFTRDKILAMFRVPKTVLGMTENVSVSNADATDRIFAKRVIKPSMMRIVEQLNEFYLPLFAGTESMFLDFEDPTPENRLELVEEANTGVGGGYITINEAREILGYDAINEGDRLVEVMPNVGNEQENLLLNKKRTYRKITPVPHVKYHKELLRYAISKVRKSERKNKLIKAIKDHVSKAIVPIVYNQLKRKAVSQKKLQQKMKLKKIWPKADRKNKEIMKLKRKFHAIYLRLGIQFEREYQEKVGGIFINQKNRALKMIKADKKRKISFPDEFFQVEKEFELYNKRVVPIQGKVITDQSRNAFALLQIDSTVTLRQKVTQEFLKKRNFQLSTSMTKTTNEKLGKTLAEGVDAGESITQLRKRISELFDGFTKGRSTNIARTEINSAGNWATEEAYKQSEVVDGKEWLATLDERTGDLDAQLDGTIVSLGGNFSVKGKAGSFTGETPPLHPQCRCVLLPVIN